ncbi:MAG: cation:proton antiporter [Oscillospiraceae bacterium]
MTAYLVAGVLIGPYCLGLLGIEGLGFPTQEAVDSLSLISEVALGFIAFSIGSEFRVSELKHTGKQAFVIGVLQALAATFLIDIALVAIALVTHDRPGHHPRGHRYGDGPGRYADGRPAV